MTLSGRLGSKVLEHHSNQLDHVSVSSDLVYEQIRQYVDGELPEQQRMLLEEHLQGCSTCRREVADLQSFKVVIDKEMALALPSDELASLQDEPGPTRPTLPQTPPRSRRPYRIAAVAACLVLAAIVAWPVARLFQNYNASSGQTESRKTANGPGDQDPLPGSGGAGPAPAGAEADKTGTPRPAGPSEQVSIPAADEVLLSDDGHTVGLNQSGSLVGFDSLPGDLRTPVAAALATSRLGLPRLGLLGGTEAVLMGAPSDAASFALRSPLGVVVEESRPLFSWNRTRSPATYTVILTNLRSGETITSPGIRGTRWQPPAALRRGESYRWEVKATLADGAWVLAPAPPEPVARFKVAASADARALEAAKRLYPHSHLLLGVLYAKAGLIDRARWELSVMAKANPDSVVAQKLFHQIERASKNGGHAR